MAVVFDPKRFWPRRTRPTDARDLVKRLAIAPSGWEYGVFVLGAFLGVLSIAASATAADGNTSFLAALCVLFLGAYFLRAGWRRGRLGFSAENRMMLLLGEVTVVFSIIELAVLTTRTLAP